jgi:hypothetical protein
LGLYSTCIDRLNSDLIPARGFPKALRSIAIGPFAEFRRGGLPADERHRSAAFDVILGYERP